MKANLSRPAIRAVLLVMVACLAVACASAGSSGSAGPVTSAATTPLATPAATPAAVVECNWDSTGCLGELTAGTYSSAQFGTPFSYTVPGGWINSDDEDLSFALTWADPSVSQEVAVWRNPLVASQAAGCPREQDPSVGSTVDDWLAWLGSTDSLTVTEPTKVTIGGQPGATVDVRMTAGWTSPVSQDGCPTAGDPIVILLTDLPSGGRRWGLGPDDPQRLVFVTAPDGSVVLFDIDPDSGATFAAFADAAMPVVTSVTFGQ